MLVQLEIPDSVVARIFLMLHDDGAMSIEGNVGDIHLATGMLDSARAAVLGQLGKPSILEPHGAGLQLPNKDVIAPQNQVYPLIAEGSSKPWAC